MRQQHARTVSRTQGTNITLSGTLTAGNVASTFGNTFHQLMPILTLHQLESSVNPPQRLDDAKTCVIVPVHIHKHQQHAQHGQQARNRLVHAAVAEQLRKQGLLHLYGVADMCCSKRRLTLFLLLLYTSCSPGDSCRMGLPSLGLGRSCSPHIAGRHLQVLGCRVRPQTLDSGDASHLTGVTASITRTCLSR